MRKKALAMLVIVFLISLSYVLATFEKGRAEERAKNEVGVLEAPNECIQEIDYTSGEIICIHDVDEINDRERSSVVTREALAGATQEIQDNASVHEALSYEEVQIDDIPVLEVHSNDSTTKQLLLFLHGLGSTKERLLPLLSAYAKEGYFVVAIDAYNHGARISNAVYCDFWASVLITMKDLEYVIEYYDSCPGVNTEGFVLGGFSMGGVEVWAYVELGDHKPGAIIALSGICEYETWRPWVQDMLPNMWLKSWKDIVWAFPEMQTEAYTKEKYDVIRDMDVSRNLEDFVGIPIFCGVGSADKYFNDWKVGQIAQSITDSGNERVVFAAYEGVGHEITYEMIEDSISFLKENNEIGDF